MSCRRGIFGPLTKNVLSVYRELGINTIFFDVDTASKKNVRQVRNEGFEVYACIWAFKALDERLGVENIQ